MTTSSATAAACRVFYELPSQLIERMMYFLRFTDICPDSFAAERRVLIRFLSGGCAFRDLLEGKELPAVLIF